MEKKEYINKNAVTEVIDSKDTNDKVIYLQTKVDNQKKMIKYLIYLICLFGVIILTCLMVLSVVKINAQEPDLAATPTTAPNDTSYINEIHQANQSAVISVLNYKKTADNEYECQESGSGFVYKYENGKYYAVTNYHIVKGNDTIRIMIDNGIDEPEQVSAFVKGFDEAYDIAVLTFDTTTEINPVVIGNSDEITIGEPVVAMGSPRHSSYQGTVTDGIVSGPMREIETSTGSYSYIQTTAAINEGSSGGPLFNAQGEVIGMINFEVAKSDVQNTDNMGFAMPINDVMEVVTEIENANKD